MTTNIHVIKRLIPVAAILTVALFFRLYALDVTPPGLYYDEAFNGRDALAVREGLKRPLFFAGNGGREPLFIYLQAVAIGLLGVNALACGRPQPS